MSGAAVLTGTFAEFGEDVFYDGRTLRAIRYDEPAESALGPGRNPRRRISFEFKLSDCPTRPVANDSVVASDGDWFIKGDAERDSVTGVWRATVEQRIRTA